MMPCSPPITRSAIPGRPGPRLAGVNSVLVLNGPNLARLGSREPEVYGTWNHDRLAEAIGRWAQEAGVHADVRQSDDETDLVQWLHEAVDSGRDVVINPAAFTHYSYALRDAAAQVTGAGLRLVEVHLTNPATRESFRHTSVIAGVATGTVAGFGVGSYRLALLSLGGTGDAAGDAAAGGAPSATTDTTADPA